MNSTQNDTSPNLDTIWSTPLGEPPTGQPVVTGDLLLVAIQESAPFAQHSELCALSLADGCIRWRQPFEYALISGLASACASTSLHFHTPTLLLVATSSTDLVHGEGVLVGLDVEGKELHRWAPGVQRFSAPVVLGDVVCVTADARTFLILDLTTGAEQARTTLEVSASLAAPILVDDVAYVPCRGPHLLAVDMDGHLRWRFDAAETPDAWLDETPVVTEELVFTVLTTGQVLALRAEDGQLAWRTSVGPAGRPLSPPATDGERLFVGARDGLHALGLADGREVWAFPTQRKIMAAPIVAGGVVYATCHDHHLYALDRVTGREQWQHEMERRIEVSPVVAACGESASSCVLVADRGGTLTAVARPISAEEHETGGRWREAVAAYAELGQFDRCAELLETHGEPFKAAELWKAAGDLERAAAQYEAAGAWQQAAELLPPIGQPSKQAELLEKHARSLEGGPASDEERATAWAVAAQAFEADGKMEEAANCRREVARCLRQPVITLDVQHRGLVLRHWSRLLFIVRNEGYGPAYNLFIRATGDEFEGQVMTTREIITLWAERERTEELDIRPLEYGDSVPLRVQIEYLNHSKELCSCEHTIYIPVARTDATRRREKTTTSVFVPISRQLADAREHLRLIRERKSEFVMETNIPLELIKQERRYERLITDLETQLAQSGDSAIPAPADESTTGNRT
ncbi:MAG: PQQ-binding-like beta-propeller repeat protein [Chloroflexota bacterium]|nr:PQQ-binding-like beta-propeller repeat protein [Chloroflexota bacterium]